MTEPTDTPLPLEHDPCRHPELIDDVRRSRKSRLPIALALVGILGGSIGGLASWTYQQGQEVGRMQVRVEQLEQQTIDARVELDRRAASLDDAQGAARDRDERILSMLATIDSRIARLEERLPAQTQRR
jgi:hypothetical protein